MQNNGAAVMRFQSNCISTNCGCVIVAVVGLPAYPVGAIAITYENDGGDVRGAIRRPTHGNAGRRS